MKLVVGLGNPGPRYAATRHNVGFRIATAVAERFGPTWESAFHGRLARCAGGALSVLLPLTWMNASGQSVVAAVDALGIAPASDLLVVYDDLDLPFGRLRLRARGGCGGHRGMESVAAALDSQAFARLRFGIGRPERGGDVVDYVLAPFTPDEEVRLPDGIGRAVEASEAWLELGVDAAMARIHRVETAAGVPADR